MACYSPAAHSLVPHITEILPYIPNKDPYTLPPILKDLENTKQRFRIHVGKGSRRGYPNFILDRATETTATPEEGSEAAPTIQAIEQQQPTEVTVGLTSPPPPVATPGQIVLRIKGAPVETPEELAETSQESEHVPARRQLFREADEEGADETLKKAKHE